MEGGVCGGRTKGASEVAPLPRRRNSVFVVYVP
jgi:hypothetical protein